MVPVHDVERYLGQALGALGQTHRDLEIVVIDDGSMDGSGELCDEYVRGDGRLAVIYQESCSLSAARNSGIDLAMRFRLGQRRLDGAEYRVVIVQFYSRSSSRLDKNLQAITAYDLLLRLENLTQAIGKPLSIWLQLN